MTNLELIGWIVLGLIVATCTTLGGIVAWVFASWKKQK